MRKLIVLFLLLLTTTAHAQTLPEPIRLGGGVGTSLVWHPDGDVIAVGTTNGIMVIDTELNVISHLSESKNVWDLDWNPEGTALVTINGQNTLVWNISPDFMSMEPSGLEFPAFEEVQTRCVQWIDNFIGIAQYTWSEVFIFEKMTAVYDVVTGQPASTIPENFEGVFTLNCNQEVISPDGSKELTYYPAYFANSSADMLVVSDVNDSSEQTITPHGSSIRTIEWAPDNYQFALLTGDGEIEIWQADKLHSTRVRSQQLFFSANERLEWSSDEKYLLSTNIDQIFYASDPNVYIWDNFEQNQSEPGDIIRIAWDHNPNARWIPNTHQIVTFGSWWWDTPVISVDNIDTSRSRNISRTLEHDHDESQTHYWNQTYTRYAYWEDGHLYLFHLDGEIPSLDWNNDLMQYKPFDESDLSVHEVTIAVAQPTYVFWSPDSTKIAIFKDGNTDTIQIWDSQSGILLLTLDGITFSRWDTDETFYGKDTSGDGIWSAITGERLGDVDLRIWNDNHTLAATIEQNDDALDQLQVKNPSGEQVMQVEADNLLTANWMSNNQIIVVTGEGVEVWNTESAQPIQTFSIGSVKSFAWSKHYLAVCGDGSLIYVWKLKP